MKVKYILYAMYHMKYSFVLNLLLAILPKITSISPIAHML